MTTTTRATAAKVTRPEIHNALKDAGLARAEWRNRERETIWNDGFMITAFESWTGLTNKVKGFVVTYEFARTNDRTTDLTNAKVAEMAQALSAAGIEFKIKQYSSGCDYIEIAR